MKEAKVGYYNFSGELKKKISQSRECRISEVQGLSKERYCGAAFQFHSKFIWF